MDKLCYIFVCIGILFFIGAMLVYILKPCVDKTILEAQKRVNLKELEKKELSLNAEIAKLYDDNSTLSKPQNLARATKEMEKLTEEIENINKAQEKLKERLDKDITKPALEKLDEQIIKAVNDTVEQIEAILKVSQ